MPLNTVQLFIKNTLDQLPVPGDCGIPGPLVAKITPDDPDESGEARAYIWPAMGRENRRAMPRNTGPNTPAAWKNLNHTIRVWLVWFDNTDSDPNADINFPGLIDAVMDALRTCVDPAAGFRALDPFTDRPSQLMNVGENMTWTYTTNRSTEDQRILIYQAEITLSILELIQA